MPLDFDPVVEARRNWERHGWASIDAMAAATSITRAHQILLSRIDGALAPSGLTFSRFEALALLHFTKDGCLPMGKVGERLQVHAASVTNTVDRLEQDGLVERRRHDADGRTVLACITAEGRKRVADAAGALGAIDFGLAGDQAPDLASIEDALSTVRRNAGDF